MEEELQKLLRQQVPIKTQNGGRFMDYVWEVKPGVVILATNADGSGRKTVLAVSAIESFTAGAAGADGEAPPAERWKQQ